MAPEKISKFYTEDLMLRISTVVCTELVRKMCHIQHTFPLASIALGRSVTGALLIASQMREGQRIGIYFRGDGPLGGIFAEANYEGDARGYCQNPQADLPLREGKLDIAGGVGKGVLTVTRSQPFEKQPHNGIVPIVSGEIGEDLAYYMFQSHQVPSVISLGVQLDGDGSLLAAGGVLIELMPGASEKLISQLEEKSRLAPSISRRIFAGDSPRDLTLPYIHDSELIPVEHPYGISYTCRCSEERVERTLRLMGRAELAQMLLKGEPVKVTCQFCGLQYTVTQEQIRELHEETSPRGS